MGGPAGRERSELSERLRARRAEIEHSALTRVHAIADPAKAADPTYAEGLRAAVSAAVDYGLASIESGAEQMPPVPTGLLVQARLAARNGVSLDTVLRRYFAGYTLLADLVMSEATAGTLPRQMLRPMQREMATLFDRVLATVSEEYLREERVRSSGNSGQPRLTGRIEGLLSGESLDTTDIAYDFDGLHLGAIAMGKGAEEALGSLAAALDRSILFLPRREGAVWAWLGGRRRMDLDRLEHLVLTTWSDQLSLVVGEPMKGIDGWRVTHQQARAALPVAIRAARKLTHYADVALLAAIYRDPLLATSLRKLYLAPLESDRHRGGVLRDTLRSYIAADHNVSSTAAALGVKRHTVTNRLRTVEESLGRPLRSCLAEIDVALRLAELEDQYLAAPEQ